VELECIAMLKLERSLSLRSHKHAENEGNTFNGMDCTYPTVEQREDGARVLSAWLITTCASLPV